MNRREFFHPWKKWTIQIHVLLFGTFQMSNLGIFYQFCFEIQQLLFTFSNSPDPDQRVPIAALWSESELFENMIWNSLQRAIRLKWLIWINVELEILSKSRAINFSLRIRTILIASRLQADRSVSTWFAEIARLPCDVRTTVVRSNDCRTVVRLSYWPYEIADL